MDREAVHTALGLDGGADPFATHWTAAMAALPKDQVTFLTPEYVADACRDVSLPMDVQSRAISAARQIAASDELRAVVWYCHYCLFVSDSFEMHAPPLHTSGMRDWPDTNAFADRLGEDRGMVYLLIVLSGLPAITEVHRRRSIPSAITERETGDVHERIRQRVAANRSDHGVPGLERNGCYWISIILRGEIFRLGRLRFQLGEFRPAESLVRLRAFRNDRTGDVVALSADGVEYHTSGQLAPAEPSGTDDVWEARFERTADAIRGHPIDPRGVALREPLELSPTCWSEVFGPAVSHLRIHIPDDGPMTFAACGEAFERAIEFFPRHFPDRPVAAFLCTSWILDTQLQALLSADSNMVRFQRELYLFPTGRYAPDEHRLARRILGEVPSDPDPSEGDTSLEVALLESLAADTRPPSGGGGGFLLPEDLAWGDQVYRHQGYPWDRPGESGDGP